MSGRSSSPLEIRLITALVIVGTFLSGAAMGVGVCYWLRHSQHHTIPAPLMGLLIGELGLNEAQEEKARAILERHRPELDAIMRASFPRVRAVDDRIELEVRAVLTESQRRTLDRLKSEHELPFGGPPRFRGGPGGEHHRWPGGLGMHSEHAPPPPPAAARPAGAADGAVPSPAPAPGASPEAPP